MPQQILWLDNDAGWLKPYVDSLREAGFGVAVASSVLEAEKKLSESRFDLLILDVMIPTMNEEEEASYPPALTKLGHQTGLVFFRRMQDSLLRKATKVLVLTVRLDRVIVDDFIKAGLPRNNLLTKLAVREVPAFVAAVKNLLAT